MTLLLCFLGVYTFGQRTYQDAIKDGNKALVEKDYFEAFIKYRAAEAFAENTLTPEVNKALVQDTIRNLFKKIDDLRTQASQLAIEASQNLEIAKAARDTADVALTKLDKAYKELEQERDSTAKAKAELQIALTKAERLAKAFYFYDDKYASAFGAIAGKIQFYYIDTLGVPVEKLRYWKKAGPFEEKGKVLVIDEWGHKYILDTAGQTVRIAEKTSEIDPNLTVIIKETNWLLKDFPNSILKAKKVEEVTLRGVNLKKISGRIGKLQTLKKLDLSGCKELKRLPPEIGQLKNLTELSLSETTISSLALEIGQLTNLTKLDLYRSEITELPSEIGQLTNLLELDLKYTPIARKPDEIDRIKTLLPNCQIYYQ